MIEFNGKYTNAKVMIDDIDQTTAAQITEFINHEAFTNPVAIMPDCHAGKGAVIGFTMELGDKVIPNTIGVDISCGMLAVKCGRKLFASMSKEDFDAEVRKVVPFGTSVRQGVSKHFYASAFYATINERLTKMRTEFQERFDYHVPPYQFDEQEFKDLCSLIGIDYDRAMNSIGTLGGGNHFIEVGKSEETGDYWTTIHCGSRNFGKCVADYHQLQARIQCNAPTVSKADYIDAVKRGFNKKSWQAEIAKYDGKHGGVKVPKGTEYLQGLDMHLYLAHMIVAQTYAEFNRKVIATHIIDVICALDADALNPVQNDYIETTHNFIDFDDWVVRKGAIRSYEGEHMVIPFNPKDGLLIVEGKSNPEWNYSAPHGAGRLFSRSEAKKKISNQDAEKAMDGVYASVKPLDESPLAYKSAATIEACIEPTATIIYRVKPVLNMKSS